MYAWPDIAATYGSSKCVHLVKLKVTILVNEYYICSEQKRKRRRPPTVNHDDYYIVSFLTALKMLLFP